MKIVEKAEHETAYTAIIKYAFNLMFEKSNNKYELDILQRVNNAPLKTDEPLNVTRYTQIDKEKEALKIEKINKKHTNQLKKLEKQRLANLKAEAESTTYNKINKPQETQKEQHNEIDVVDQGIALTTTTKQRIRNSKLEKLLLHKLKELYISYRGYYVVQYFDKRDGIVKYTYAKNNEGEYIKLHDSKLTQHLRQKSTIGVFSGEELTGFLCFDVDSSDIEHSKQIALDLHDVLSNIFLIADEYITISLSGSKGYHVEIFFENMIKNSEAKLLYTAVTQLLKPLKGVDVEYRPTHKQAVKPPLSINLKTGNVCYFVDNKTFEPILEEEHLLTIKQIPFSKTQEIFDKKDLFTLNNEQAVEIGTVMDEIKPKYKTEENIQSDVVDILTLNKLKYSFTRHNTTLKVAMFMKEQGNNEVDTEAIIQGIMHNTWNLNREMFNSDTTLEFIDFEIKRLVQLVFENNYGENKKPKKVKIYQTEIESILDLPKKQYKNLLYTLIVHSKRFAKTDGKFYMAYSTIESYGNSKNRTRILNYLNTLQELRMIEIVKRGSINKALTLEKGHVMYEANIYKVLVLHEEIEDDEVAFIELAASEEFDFYKAATGLIDKKILKEKTSVREWNQIKKLYA